MIFENRYTQYTMEVCACLFGVVWLLPTHAQYFSLQFCLYAAIQKTCYIFFSISVSGTCMGQLNGSDGIFSPQNIWHTSSGKAAVKLEVQDSVLKHTNVSLVNKGLYQSLKAGKKKNMNLKTCHNETVTFLCVECSLVLFLPVESSLFLFISVECSLVLFISVECSLGFFLFLQNVAQLYFFQVFLYENSACNFHLTLVPPHRHCESAGNSC